MERKRLILILAAAALAALLVCAALAYGSVTFIRSRLPTPTAVPEAITLCDVDASRLCLLSFGTNLNNELVINLHLSGKDFPGFYAQVSNRGTLRRFRCEIIEETPSSAYCVGPRTPLGEPLGLSLFASEDDRLLAQGSFVLQAVALPTFSDATATATETPASEEPAGTPTFPGEGGPPPGTPTRTPAVPTGYPP